MDVLDLTRELASLKERFLQTQERTDELCRPLTPEDCLLSVTADTSPPKWHLGHTTWFFAKFVLERFTHYEVSPELDFVFNSYYKGVGVHIPKTERASIARPGVEEIREWREEIRARMVDCLENITVDDFADIKKIVDIGTNHEEQHQELLLMDIKRNFFANPIRPRYKSRVLSSAHELTTPAWLNVPSGLIRMGVPLGEEKFHYDNESDSHMRWIDSFMLMSHPVTNGEFLEFVREGGYQSARFWLSDGWDLVRKENWQHPLYWEERDGEWWTFTLWGMVPLDLRAPACHLSYYEADAYARFRGARLPTEFEWEAAASRTALFGQFLEEGTFEAFSPEEGHMFAGIHGTVWEWTQSAYLPYPRYEAYGGELAEYNGKFMVNQMVLRGGSCVTPLTHYRATYRNFYYPHNRWQYSGVRLAKDLT
ncbi:MAG: ergothioneine biosynthesis protein EgtB [Bacteriovoracaceae bacterium]